MSDRPTLKTIGQLLGLSHTAVSKALRDAPDISDATKARVRKAAEELGYTPNLMARNLYLQRTGAIGMLVPAMGYNTAYDPIFNEVSAAAAERGYCVMLGSCHRSVELETRHCRMMVGNQVGALIVAPCTSDISHIKAACGPTPVIFIGGRVGPEEDCALLCDYSHSGELAVGHLADLGHRDIALLTYGPENQAVITQKEQGYILAMERRGLVPRSVRAGSIADAMGAGMDAVRLLLEEDRFPTALWCASDYMAVGAIKALKAGGLSVPGDVSVMGFDDLYADPWPNMGLTTLHTPMTEIGRAAAELAISLIEHREHILSRQMFRSSLVVRNSTAPVRPRPLPEGLIGED